MTHRDARLFLELTLERSPEEGIRTLPWVPQEAALRPPPACCVTTGTGGGGGGPRDPRPPSSVLRNSTDFIPESDRRLTEANNQPF